MSWCCFKWSLTSQLTSHNHQQGSSPVYFHTAVISRINCIWLQILSHTDTRSVPNCCLTNHCGRHEEIPRQEGSQSQDEENDPYCIVSGKREVHMDTFNFISTNSSLDLTHKQTKNHYDKESKWVSVWVMINSIIFAFVLSFSLYQITAASCTLVQLGQFCF